MASFSWNTTSQGTYDDNKFDFVADVEESGDPKEAPYLDGDAIPTIGIGFNLTVSSVREQVLLLVLYPDGDRTSFLSEDAAYITDLVDLIEDNWTGQSAGDLQTALNQVMADRAADTNVTYGNKRTTFTFESEADIETVFNEIDDSYESIIDAWNASVPESSDERVALFSLAYNSPSLLGPNLDAAIDAENRAEAWYEIRYNSNGDGIEGIAKRRYFESQAFGLYNPGSVDEAEARQIFQTVTRHWADIKDYDTLYGTQVAAANNHYTYPITVQDRDESLEDALDFLVDIYAENASIDRVWVDYANVDGSGSETDNLDFSEEAENSLLLAGAGDDTAATGEGNDYIYGEAGEDTIYGNEGIDRLYGGANKDIIFGHADEGDLVGDILHGGDTELDVDPAIDGVDKADYSLVNLGMGIEFDLVFPEAGTATAWSSSTDVVSGESDILISIEHVLGTSYDDKFIDTEGVSNIYEGGGGDGDVVDYSLRSEGIEVFAIDGVFESEEDELFGIERVIGSAELDTLDFSALEAGIFVDLYNHGEDEQLAGLAGVTYDYEEEDRLFSFTQELYKFESFESIVGT